MILGVFLHGAAAYMRIPMPGLIWPVRDPAWCWGFDLSVWYLHGFRMPLFFLVGGFFAALLCRSRGDKAYLHHRLKRIAVPLLVAIAVILPVTYFLWGLGLAEQGLATWREVVRMSFRDPILKDDLLGLAHLWFLEYLLLFSLVFYGLRTFFPGALRFPRRVHLLDAWWRPFPLVLISLGLLLLRPEIYTHFDNRWMPDPLGLAYYGLFFLVGSRLYEQRGSLHRLIPHSGPFILASLLLFVPLFTLLRWRLSGEPISPLSEWLFAGTLALYSWLAVWGFLGACLTWFRIIPGRVRFVADAAYWIYLIHLPLVGLIQLSLRYAEDLWAIRIPPLVGFILAVGGTLAIALFSYRYFVRYGVIGRWLSGPRTMRRDSPRGHA